MAHRQSVTSVSRLRVLPMSLRRRRQTQAISDHRVYSDSGKDRTSQRPICIATHSLVPRALRWDSLEGAMGLLLDTAYVSAQLGHLRLLHHVSRGIVRNSTGTLPAAASRPI